ncbi:hypothetical protein AX16_004309 [Volvariella volvacea WC 439]|uniref:Putative laccase 3 peptidase n=2 Tax=Volvariella volvacea TaxID=36659 RepID=U5QBD5_9AGAR|nr:putative laccase 3 peptidase [Volvariella volvacea]KAF8652588.1 hypothetical protein AX16_004309 [Volvariella volvacea WC 439]
MLSPTLVALSVLFATTAFAIGPVTELQIVNDEIAPDGFSRGSVLANGAYPGPLITGSKGDRFLINVINELTDTTMLRATSIHWHGFFQNHTAWADGVASVTQCPIVPSESFLYNFTVPDQAGTFWYHSHLSTQYCDGLRGPLVVYDPDDPHRHLYDIDDESTIITLSDWYHVKAPVAGLQPTPMSTLINGRGRYAGGPNVPLEVINVVPGTRYRFRLVSMVCDPNYIFSIDGHELTIIEADGVNTKPLTVDSIQIFAGQRYSFILNANQPVDNYWIRANPNLGTTGFTNGINSAILRYEGAPLQDPTTPLVPSVNPLVESNLRNLIENAVPGQPFPGGADININLFTDFDWDMLHFTVNGSPYIPPNAPVLLQILSGTYNAQDLMPAGSIIELPSNKVIEISMPGGSPGSPHPFHLHGHTFDVIRSTDTQEYNFVDPVRRDVVNTGFETDNVTIRFTTDNPGPWILHCHIDWHLEVGLAVVFAEDIPRISTPAPPPSWDELCPEYDRFPVETFDQ